MTSQDGAKDNIPENVNLVDQPRPYRECSNWQGHMESQTLSV